MRIIQMTASNVKRLTAVDIKADGGVVVVSGKNAAGKSSVLDAIEMALRGRAIPSEPVRRGAEKAEIRLELGERDDEGNFLPGEEGKDLIVTRKIRPDGTNTLEVTSPNGLKHGSPQKLLDALHGNVAFDPLEFTRMKPREQAEVLKAVTGLDFGDIDNNRQAAYDTRTAANRELQAAKGHLESMPIYEGFEPIDVAGAMKELEAAEAVNKGNQDKRGALLDLQRIYGDLHGILADAEAEVKEARDEVARKKAEVALAEKALALMLEEKAKCSAAAAVLQDIDPEPLRQRIRDAEEVNAKVRANDAREETVAAVAERTELVRELTDRIGNLDEQKRKMLAATDMPIDGLKFSDADGVTFWDIPFEQCSQAEQLRISTAIGFAQNPELKVLLIRDGSLLDEDNRKLLAEMADEVGGQLWLEVVGDDAQATVVIEDGAVAAAKPSPEVYSDFMEDDDG